MELTNEQLSKINELINLAFTGQLAVVKTEFEDNYGAGEKSQGDIGKKVCIYKTDINNVFIKAIYEDDSYGNELGLRSIQFVKPITKTILDYETIS
jgi:hypothetical protein